MISILEQARREGREAGLRIGRTFSEMEWDEAREQGRIEGLSQSPARWPWFLAGIALGGAVAGLIT